MAEIRWMELPEHVVAKIEKVLGIPPSELAQYDIVKLVEELCDTALMFDREDRRGDRTREKTPAGETSAPPGSAPQTSH